MILKNCDYLQQVKIKKLAVNNIKLSLDLKYLSSVTHLEMVGTIQRKIGLSYIP